MYVKKEMITHLMSTRTEICEKLNDFISPQKKIQPQKGVRLDGIHITPYNYCWSAIIFPQWVKIDADPIYSKEYRFICDRNGNFIKWDLKTEV